MLVVAGFTTYIVYVYRVYGVYGVYRCLDSNVCYLDLGLYTGNDRKRIHSANETSETSAVDAEWKSAIALAVGKLQ